VCSVAIFSRIAQKCLRRQCRPQKGDFYGTTGDGTVFGLSVGLGPFAKTMPTSGDVRSGRFKILGTVIIRALSVEVRTTLKTLTSAICGGSGRRMAYQFTSGASSRLWVFDLSFQARRDYSF
jgi:hypothetical protein